MRAGSLKERITIQEPITVKTSTGSESIEYNTHLSVRARVDLQGGTKTNENGDIFYTHTVTFHIRRIHGSIDERYRIVWKGRNYMITGPIEYNDQFQSIIIRTELVNDFEL